MNKRVFQIVLLVLALVFVGPMIISAQEIKPIPLLKPQTDGGRPLMQVLGERKTSRAFSPEKLPAQVLSNLLWAAFGINRPDSGRRTAPSALNWQEIDLYVATSDGLFLYEAKEHRLKTILTKDIRVLTGRQPYVKESPVSLVYVADFSKMGRSTYEEKEIYAAADSGFISQNVYLFCASEGLATGVRALIDRSALSKEMNLRPDQRITLAQSVGYPKK
ncbi:MAG: SagB/ThcOx family dehydrogenase [Thermodesulfobacteriota bacterium]